MRNSDLMAFTVLILAVAIVAVASIWANGPDRADYAVQDSFFNWLVNNALEGGKGEGTR